MKDKVREPIADFVKVINEELEKGVKPTKWVLNFRDWQISNTEVDVYKIKTQFLRFRKDNGRISSDVESYEILEAPLQEESAEAQDIIKGFLWEKSPDRIRQLMSLLKHSTQQEPAIITCDGFLVNGNRRKLALEKLYEETKDEKYLRMKVVILPQNTTLKEIEQVENRYQYHSDGKEEYTHFDKALSIRRKEKNGISLDEQLMDDPEIYNLSGRKLTNKIEKVRMEYLGTLNCIDAYLANLGRNGLYNNVAEGPGDREGRWEAFMTFNKGVFSKLIDSKECRRMNIKENEVGKVIETAFKIIRKRDLKKGRLNDVMRSFPKILKDETAKREILKLADEPMQLTAEEITNNEVIVDDREQDKIWGGRFGTEIIKQVVKAQTIIDTKDIRDKPMDILDDALKKLQHKDLDLGDIDAFEIDTAMDLVEEIIDTAGEIYEKLDKMRYQFKQLKKGKLGK